MPGLVVRVRETPADAVAATATTIRRRLAGAIGRRGRATLALSGGSTGTELAAALATGRPPAGGWGVVGVWQVDERVAPDGDPDRNANGLAPLVAAGAAVHPMPVTADDLDRAAADYGAGLPARFDIVHLGVGPDGHTASWPPGDPIVDGAAPVGLSRRYQGRIRMSLRPGPVNDATARVVLITGADKAAAVAAWLDGGAWEGDLPVRYVGRRGTTLVLDRDAAGAARSGT